MQIKNQTPATLVPRYDATIKGDYDIEGYAKQMMAAPLFVPLSPNAPVTITSNGKVIDENVVTSGVLACCGTANDPVSEEAMKKLYGKTLLHFDEKTTMSIQDTFAIQAANTEGMQEPSNTTLYTPATDVIPTAKEFLAGQSSFDKFFASLTFYARPSTLGVMCTTESAFDNFKAWLANEISQISPMLSQTTNQMFADFQQLTLDKLTESIAIRNDYSDNNEELSFARTIVAYIMKYVKTVSPSLFAIMPFSVMELLCPTSIVFVNVEQHARATQKQVADEWKIINTSIKNPINMISNKKLSKLTATVRSISKIKSAAQAAAAGGSGMLHGAQRAANIKFRKSAPTTLDMVKLIKKVISKMANVSKSENIYKASKMTFARPNRRDPDDFNKKGKMVSTKYRPDIHLYIDTSGSISERNYQDAVKACIKMAKKLNINLYFNSFSHVLSQCTKLNTKDKTISEVYREFQRLPKVTGGTDYEQIWNYIEKSKKRRRELSIIMTDFEYYAPNRYVKHPKNLYYMPMSHMDYKNMVHWAENFCKSATHIDPNIRKHLLF